jgi:hypothetical protein
VVFCVVTPCRLKGRCYSFGGTHRLHIQGMANQDGDVVPLYKTTRCHNLLSRHQTACFKATEGLHLPPPFCAAQTHQHSVATLLRFERCLHWPGLRCSCCNVVRFCCDPEACNLVTTTTGDHNRRFYSTEHLKSQDV